MQLFLPTCVLFLLAFFKHVVLPASNFYLQPCLYDYRVVPCHTVKTSSILLAEIFH